MLLPPQRFARGCSDVRFDTLPKLPLASQELLTTWKGVILHPGLLALGHKPGCSHSIHISCAGCSSKLSTKTNHSPKNTGELTEIQQRAAYKDDPQWVFLSVLKTFPCASSHSAHISCAVQEGDILTRSLGFVCSYSCICSYTQIARNQTG